MSRTVFMQGNEAMTEGAIVAGARFYAGYPITPSSEVAETSSIRLPQVGGLYVQMEDELGSMAALIGASCSGKKAYTATSGPGLSLMAENLGVAVMGEIPCVLIDVQRSGPSTGLATKPAQGDVMQSRWGTHGDHGIIVISPSSVQDCFDLMITAFNYAEEYRTPVIFLADAIIGHLEEQCVLREPGEVKIVERRRPACDPAEYKPYDHSHGLAPLASYGSEYVFKVNGSMRDEMGRPCSRTDNADAVIRHLTDKIEKNKEKISIVRRYQMDDAEYVIFAYGGVARSALSAMQKCREKGIKAGVVQFVTLWPVSDAAIDDAMSRVKAAVFPEMNLGQYIDVVRARNPRNIPVLGVNRVDSRSILPAQIVEKVEEAARTC
ncbi:MAG: 2-oxoacid:acceptor oxidoreductase subunit alpha [Pyramidobacter sp.]|nr:2-oxoacid:acceptor oxidoreductase subunit alpha [Pyramidobacter sp.]MBP3836945.1 2-oxoacid:acceptor oxidoreductase subunit alpha [Pyramidobacter sp.]MBP3848436.1 2-oxoacid:acceptor oxidoreductase subunit alpha [Pyramidobacter sp.]MBQ4491178.1 2-oxoacid:acceptor oxidoreductase subunit alpha [Pyramidobacter sp.]MBR0108615.1 2-oxoacid:acceptor oxidoreductase subunit alpha [Pyramidobacter sp.]